MSNKVEQSNQTILRAKDAKSNFGLRGWLLVIGMIFCTFVAGACGNDGLNTIIPQFAQRFGWEQATLTVLASVSGYISAIALAIMGVIVHKYGARNVLVFTMACLAVAIFGWGFATTLPAYFLVIIILYSVSNGVGLCMGILVSNWFPTKKGLVMGWTTMGFNLATVGINWLLVFGWDNFGWHGGFNLFALVAVIGLVLVLCFVREFPEDCGCVPDNDKSISPEKAKAMRDEGVLYAKTSLWTVKKLLMTPATWFIAIVYGSIMMMVVGCISQLVPTVQSYGFSLEFALTCMSIAGFCGFFGSYLTGWVDTKFGTKKATVAMMIWEILTVIVFVSPLPQWKVIIATGMLGIIIGGGNDLCSSMTTQVFGRYDQKKAYSVIWTIFTVVRSTGVGLVGVIAARTGTYAASWATLGVIIVIALILSTRIPNHCIGRVDVQSTQ